MQTYLGTWQIAPSDGFWTGQDISESEAVVSAAVRAGICGFDTARSYGKGKAEQTLSKILRVLRKTGAQVIFATSTPVVDPHHDLNSQTIAWYNHEALRLMKQEDVPIDDLYSLVYPNREAFICEDHCHLSEAGKEACSDAVVKAIEAYL